MLGLAIAVAAVTLRLVAGSEVGRDQIVFSYPAVVLATYLFGRSAGATAAIVCLLVAWYYVIPPTHSLAVRDVAAFTTLAIDVLVSSTLVVTISSMKTAIARLRHLTHDLERRVDEQTAERNRLWQRSPELIAIAAPDGRVQDINPAFATRVARTVADGINLFDLLSDADAAELGEAIGRLSSGSEAETLEADLRGLGHDAIVAWSIVLDDGMLYLIGRDVTAERECNERLRQSQKVEALGQMTGGLAHDLANYLNPIGISLELIRRHHPDDARTAELVQGAADSVERADALVRRLLRFARREKTRTGRIALRDQLQALVPLLRQTTRARRLVTRFADDLPDILVDANELDGALLNLAANARDATRAGDRLTLSAGMADPAHAVIELTDTGVGMDAATLMRAREPFFSTKACGQGTGLGLAMVEDFARRSNGRLEITSEPNVGTRVALILPVAS